MPIITVNYTKTYNLGNYSSEKIGIELSLNEGEDAKQALQEAKKLADEFHLENNKGLYCQDMNTGKVSIGESVPQMPEIIQQTKPTTKLSREESMIALINRCTQIDGVGGLGSFKLIVKSNPKLKEAYDNKLKSLQ